MNSHTIRHLILAAAAVLLFTAAAGAKSLKVSSNGFDDASCGSGANPPCASIGQAISNAANGDSILVGPGRYAGFTVDKPLKLWSSGGTGGAVISSEVILDSDGIVFGKGGKGFGVSPDSIGTAILVNGNGVTVRGNSISDCTRGIDAQGSDVTARDNSFDNCGTAIRIASSGAQVRGNRVGYAGSNGVLLADTSSGADVRENRMFGPSGIAIVIGGSGHLVRRNYVHGTPGGGFNSTGTPTDVHLLQNVVVSSSSPAYYMTAGSGWVLTGNAAFDTSAPGFYLSAGTPFTLLGNVAIGNSGQGFLISGGSDHVLEGNSAIDNQGDGILLGSIGAGVQVSGGNLYGNSSNCGLVNSSSSGVAADGVYWGAPSGPGLDPADDLCGNTAAIVVSDPASKAAAIKLPAVK